MILISINKNILFKIYRIMSVTTMLNSTIKHLNSNITNEFVIQNVVSELVDKFNKSPVVTVENKQLLNQYYNSIKNTKPAKPVGSKLFNMTGGANVIQQAIAYYLSNSNRYDEILFNYGVSYGLNVDKLILLILLNNIDDIREFCKSNNLNQQQILNIITLKRLSALHNLEHNF